MCLFVATFYGLVILPLDFAFGQVEITRSKIPLSKTSEIKVVYQINTAELKSGIHKGLYYLSYLMDHYKRLGVPESEIKLSAVFYGDAISSLLKDPYYNQRGGKGRLNPNKAKIDQLKELGVSLEACAETMRMRDVDHSELIDGVKVVEGAYVRVIDLQLNGYAYIKFL